MENIIESLSRTATATTTTTAATTTTRRLRSLYLPTSSSTEHMTEFSRRFSSLRRSINGNISQPTPSVSVERKKIRIKLVPNVSINSRCFVFDVVDHELESGGSALKLGRYSDRTVVADRISFKSKVVSRYHAEIWLSEVDNKIYIKDSGSSSGTFVNHTRLSSANTESDVPHEIVDGDLIQLGMDYKGGVEPVFRAVKMRLEVDRQEWRKASSNAFCLAAFQQLRNQIKKNSGTDITTEATTPVAKSEEIQECCICLYCIAPFQALFIAPCSHTYHYRCIRPLLVQNYPGFSCPLCRTYSNLEASVAVEENEVMEMLGIVSPEKNAFTKNNPKTPAIDDEGNLRTSHFLRQREKTVIAEEDHEEVAIDLNIAILIAN
ncbi:MAG: hypothetical protein EXX96DRAFT_540543 [Benjaminiella poitrasii]|nr:MAG: hypothetical protein EXX96DRAFT_540543 [Benjaminiella poitrasii]